MISPCSKSPHETLMKSCIFNWFIYICGNYLLPGIIVSHFIGKLKAPQHLLDIRWSIFVEKLSFPANREEKNTHLAVVCSNALQPSHDFFFYLERLYRNHWARFSVCYKAQRLVFSKITWEFLIFETTLAYFVVTKLLPIWGYSSLDDAVIC